MEEGERDHEFGDLASRVPKTEMGCRLSLVWELGKKGSGRKRPYPCLGRASADFLRAQREGEERQGRAGSSGKG